MKNTTDKYKATRALEVTLNKDMRVSNSMAVRHSIHKNDATTDNQQRVQLVFILFLTAG